MITELLSRIQFAFTMTAHVQFPAISIGLVAFIVLCEGCYLATTLNTFYRMARFFTKIFALTFGMGVVSGIVMEYQLGTNWGGFSERVGPLLGTLFVYEVMTAFFVEAGFLGVMIYGWERVSARMHFFATCMVCLGTHLSAFWIMSANSWMQTPSGYYLTPEGFFASDNYLEVIFNPSVWVRFAHMLFSCYLSAGFIILGICAYYFYRGVHKTFALTTFRLILKVLLVIAPLQLVMGDLVGLKVFHHQPIKTAAMAANWDTQPGVPLLLFAIPDQQQQTNHFAIGIPKLESLINTHELNGVMPGLKTVPPADQPHVALVFYTFRIMVFCGLMMLIVTCLGAYYWYQRQIMLKPWFHRLMMLTSPMGLIALQMGWFTAEVGRQPWVVYGLLRTSEASTSVQSHEVAISLLALIIVYAIIFGFFFLYYLIRFVQKGPVGFGDDDCELTFHYLETFDKKQP